MNFYVVIATRIIFNIFSVIYSLPCTILDNLDVVNVVTGILRVDFTERNYWIFDISIWREISSGSREKSSKVSKSEK